jgi:hypothetical protein
LISSIFASVVHVVRAAGELPKADRGEGDAVADVI